MKQKFLITLFLYTGLIAVLVINFQNCSSSSRFAETQVQQSIAQNPESNSEVENEEEQQEVDLTHAKLTLQGVVQSGWRNKQAISSAPIAGVTLHLKVGPRSDPATKNKPDYATFTTNATGVFEFRDLPNNTYTIYWDVPAHMYHENDYATEQKVTQLNEVRDISGNIWVHQHGVVYKCMYDDYLPMKNLTVKLYESTSPGSKTRANSTALLTTTSAEDGSFYLDTAHFVAGKSGVVELSNSNGTVVGKVALDQLNYLGFSGGGLCE